MDALQGRDSKAADASSGKGLQQSDRANGSSYIIRLSARKIPVSVGNKAKNLRLLRDRRMRVPDTCVCTWDAFLASQRDAVGVMDRLKEELATILIPGQAYAVRSSANVEDSLAHSFAGQFATVLNLTGVDQVLQAVCAIWESTRSPGVLSYLHKVSDSNEPLKMAVIIQDMINPVLSGVSFSKNPITGLDEVVVEAVRGSGTALVQEGVTPFRWVNKWGRWVTRPDEPGIPLDLIQDVADQTRSISRLLGKDVDLEWVYDGTNLYWLQLRDITALGNTNIYSNRIAKEMTPGMIKPLVWSVKVPIPASVWIGFFKELLGKVDVDPSDLAHAFYYRAYFNMGVFGRIFDTMGMPRESLEIMMGVSPPGADKPKFMPRMNMRMLRRMPHMLSFAWDKWSYTRQVEADYNRIKADAAKYPLSPSPDLSEAQLLGVIDELIILNRRSTYETTVTILLMQFYNRMLKSRLEQVGVEFQQFALTEDMPTLAQYEPHASLQTLNRQYCLLSPDLQDSIRLSDYAAFQELPGIQPFQAAVAQFLAQFGHLSDIGTDFSFAPWRETPDLILKVITGCHHKGPEQPSPRMHFEDLPVKGLQKRILAYFYHKARQFRLYREMHSSLFTYTLMLFRGYYLALGDHLVRRGLLASRQDIFFLYDDEVRSLVAGQVSGEGFGELVLQRHAEMEAYRDVLLPEVIYGDVPPPIFAASNEKLTGTPTSRGYYTGKVKVVRSIGDFPKLAEGDVLVIPYSDVGWTPLFARAGAVIAESGGILSHSSIIAREYNIPAVVSVAGAMQLCDNTTVTIDGYKGEITVHPA
jgi:phosphohistidine swiveling domain-containing protein